MATPAQAAPSPAKLKAQAAKLKRETGKLKRANRTLAKQVKSQRLTIAGLESDVSTAIKAVPLERFRAVVLTPVSLAWPCADTTVDQESGSVSDWSFRFSSSCEATDYERLPY